MRNTDTTMCFGTSCVSLRCVATLEWVILLFSTFSLKGKWLWKFGLKGDDLMEESGCIFPWSSHFGWESRAISTPYDCGVWRGFMNVNKLFWEGVRYTLGYGGSIFYGRSYGWGRNPWERFHFIIYVHLIMSQLMHAWLSPLVLLLGTLASLDLLMIGNWSYNLTFG